MPSITACGGGGGTGAVDSAVLAACDAPRGSTRTGAGAGAAAADDDDDDAGAEVGGMWLEAGIVWEVEAGKRLRLVEFGRYSYSNEPSGSDSNMRRSGGADAVEEADEAEAEAVVAGG